MGQNSTEKMVGQHFFSRIVSSFLLILILYTVHLLADLMFIKSYLQWVVSKYVSIFVTEELRSGPFLTEGLSA